MARAVAATAEPGTASCRADGRRMTQAPMKKWLVQTGSKGELVQAQDVEILPSGVLVFTVGDSTAKQVVEAFNASGWFSFRLLHGE